MSNGNINGGYSFVCNHRSLINLIFTATIIARQFLPWMKPDLWVFLLWEICWVSPMYVFQTSMWRNVISTPRIPQERSEDLITWSHGTHTAMFRSHAGPLRQASDTWCADDICTLWLPTVSSRWSLKPSALLQLFWGTCAWGILCLDFISIYTYHDLHRFFFNKISADCNG